MCRFLIEEGANVDFVEPALDFKYREDGKLMKVEDDPDLSISRRVHFNPTAKASEQSTHYT